MFGMKKKFEPIVEHVRELDVELGILLNTNPDDRKMEDYDAIFRKLNKITKSIITLAEGA